MTALRLLCDACSEEIAVVPRAHGAPEACPHCGDALTWREGVLVLGGGAAVDDYPDDIGELLVSVEPRHFWFDARNRLLLSTMRESIGELAGKRAVDIGCGTGYVLSALEQAGMEVCGIDMHLDILRHARKRVRGLLIRHDAGYLPLARQFDVATLCDVIEHADDDVGVLAAAAATVSPGGAVVVTVPAQPGLWSPLDEVYGHKRRYTSEALQAALERAGLDPLLVRRFNVLLYVPQRLQRRALRRLSADRDRDEILRRGLAPPPRPLDAVLRVASRLELPLSRRSPRLGTSIVAVARVA